MPPLAAASETEERMQRELDIVSEAVRRAGTRVMELARHGFETHIKKDRSPVTTADLEVNRILYETLEAHFPADGWLSEESPDRPDRLGKKRVWVIDPIDGTKYFMRGEPTFAISAALVDNGRPVVGVLFNPATGEFFSAVRGWGAWLNEQRISARQASHEPLTVLVHPPSLRQGKLAAFEPYAECRPMGSIAYTLGLVAAGQADASMNFERMNEWDVAAGILLVEEAGGSVTDSKGLPIVFNRENTAVHGILASSSAAKAMLEALLKRGAPAEPGGKAKR
jgi:myo-inositol-1(or 4)-monophosphatase